MSKEKKVNKAEEVKEEKGVELTDEEMAEVNAGGAATDMMLFQAADLEVALAERMAVPEVVQAERMAAQPAALVK